MMEWVFGFCILLAKLYYANSYANNEPSLPVRYSRPPLRSNECVGDYELISEGQSFIKSRLDPQLNEMYGPSSCHCGENWERLIYSAESKDWNECSDERQDCKSITNITNKPHSKVCGTVRASYKETLRNDSAFAFENYFRQLETIDGAYLNGLSVTYNNGEGNRNHAWSFVVPQSKGDIPYRPYKNCDCTNSNFNWPFQLPTFVGNRFFCDSSDTEKGVLWSGQDCGSESTCCNRHSHHPSWFCRDVPDGLDKLEVRHFGNSINISLIDIYVGN